MSAIGYMRPAATIYDFLPSRPVWEAPDAGAFTPHPSTATPALAMPASSTQDPGGCDTCISAATRTPAPVANVTQALPAMTAAATGTTTSPDPRGLLAAIGSWWWLVLLVIVAVIVYLAKRK